MHCSHVEAEASTSSPQQTPTPVPVYPPPLTYTQDQEHYFLGYLDAALTVELPACSEQPGVVCRVAAPATLGNRPAEVLYHLQGYFGGGKVASRRKRGVQELVFEGEEAA